jgi:hypothetical protein
VLIGVILLDDESFEGYGDGIVPADQRAGVDLVVPVHHDRRRARLHRSVRAGEKRSGQGVDLGGRAVHQQLAVWPMQARPDDAARDYALDAFGQAHFFAGFDDVFAGQDATDHGPRMTRGYRRLVFGVVDNCDPVTMTQDDAGYLVQQSKQHFVEPLLPTESPITRCLSGMNERPSSLLDGNAST